MPEHRKSDRPVVPVKLPNKPGSPVAEGVEGRGLAKGNLRQQHVPRTLSRTGTPHALERVRRAEAERHHPRQEPDAVVPLVRICGGGQGQP